MPKIVKTLDSKAVEDSMKKLKELQEQKRSIEADEQTLMNKDVKRAVIADMKAKIAMFNIKPYQLFVSKPKPKAKVAVKAVIG